MKKIDVGNLRTNPIVLYDLCVRLGDLLDCTPAAALDNECGAMLQAVQLALWDALPSTVVIDLSSST